MKVLLLLVLTFCCGYWAKAQLTFPIIYFQDTSGVREENGLSLNAVFNRTLEIIREKFGIIFVPYVYDTQSVPNMIGAIEYIKSKKIYAVVAPYSSGQTSSLLQYFKDTLILSYSNTMLELSNQSGLYIRLNPVDLVQAKTLGLFMKNNGCSRISLIRTNDAYGDSYYDQLRNTDLTIIHQIQVDPTEDDISLNRMENFKTDSTNIILVVGTPPLFQKVVRYAQLFGMENYIYVFDTGSANVVTEFINTVTGILPHWYSLLPAPGKLYHEKKIESDPVLSQSVNQYGIYLYDTLTTLAVAIQDLINEGYSIDQLNATLIHEKILGISFEGFTGPISFDSTGNRIIVGEVVISGSICLILLIVILVIFIMIVIWLIRRP